MHVLLFSGKISLVEFPSISKSEKYKKSSVYITNFTFQAKLKQEQEEKERQIFAEKQAASERKRQEMKLAKQVQGTIGYYKGKHEGETNQLTGR